MKVGIDARHLVGKKRGIGYYIKNFVKYMLKEVKEIEFFLFAHEEIKLDFYDERLKIFKLKFPFYSQFFSPFWLNFYLPLYSKKIDIFHCPNFFCPFFSKNKIVITVHDLAPIKFPEFYPKIYSIYFKNFLIPSIKKANAIITPTNTIKKEVEDFFPFSKGKVFCVYHGIEEIFKPAYKKDENLKYILYVGALIKRKNIIGILKTFYILKEKYKIPHYLLLVGKKENHSKEIEEEILNHPYRNFIIEKGYVEDEELIKIYQNADVFLFPSFYEGFGLPVLEAMKCGVPVVVSKNEIFMEITKGEAVFVNPFDYEEIAYNVYKVLTDENLKKNLIKKGLAVSSLYKWEKAVNEIYKIYKFVLNF
jgi:glycosyltransferase involved in cell wall biosynthesis